LLKLTLKLSFTNCISFDQKYNKTVMLN